MLITCWSATLDERGRLGLLQEDGKEVGMTRYVAARGLLQASRDLSIWWVWLLLALLLALLVLWFFSLRRVEADDSHGLSDELKDEQKDGYKAG